ncbi:uncharacterized protein DNG_00875 [Cephalotrichum gorgonifer]|uniref:Up-regulated during septation protein 1 domain-containing protein n=1 Tax=Cephalotrichum gorgonifer TaxID=2041049 RepID=A0AAE8SR52_9PEZI|nr:uncharacterized protein DNG_00875 [Cephalotrichum gorgonifer]
MYQPESRKYQLFPKGGQTTTAKGLDPEQAFAHAIAQSSKMDKSDKLAAATNGLRLRIKEHNLNRRRKISVPELGPMTTVQEASMDSPTIPGRPALHERSISAPGSSWKQNQLDRTFTYSPIDEVTLSDSPSSDDQRATRQLLSQRQLAPLVIPSQQGTAPRLARQLSLTRMRSGGSSSPAPADNTQLRPARTDESPRTRTPLSSSSTTMTASTAVTASTLPTPLSAPVMESRSSPTPWEGRARATTPTQTTIERAATPKTDEPRSANAVIYGHRRGVSESIMDRGRPKKKDPINDVLFNTSPVLKRTPSKRSKSAERRAFEQLPKGCKAKDAANFLTPTEIADLQKQAIGQAARFEVLKKEDVEALSRELRHLDERTEYLRRTYTSLRAGRRNLHSRICQYLRSPREAKFSHDSMLKQEEVLAELDTSIDDWVSKLEHAENRRTRVRQKLLEHVAAAATLPSSNGTAAASESLQLAMGIQPQQQQQQQQQQQRQYNGVGNISTPPRSPTKVSFPSQNAGNASPTPSLQRVVAQVPSTILEETTTINDDARSVISTLTGRDCESIRIYADSDVYALLADVESEFTKMGAVPASGSETQELHRARSHDILCGTARPDSPTTEPSMSRAPTPPSKAEPSITRAPTPPSKTEPSTSRAPTPPSKAEPSTSQAPSPQSKEEPVEPKEASEPIFLTSAVFKPEVPQRSLATST